MIDKNNKYHEMMVKLGFMQIYYPTGNPKEKKKVMFWINSKVPYESCISDKRLQEIIKYNPDVLVGQYLGKKLSKKKP